MSTDDPSSGRAEAVRAAEQRAASAFEHAVRHELDSIEMHERAAERHDAVAQQHEHSASDSPEPERSALLTMAAQERERADHARQRAEHARARLRDEGIEPP